MAFQLLESTYKESTESLIMVKEQNIHAFSSEILKVQLCNEQMWEGVVWMVESMVRVLIFSPYRVKVDWYCQELMNEKYLNILFKTTQVINRKFYIIITLQLYKKESYLSQYNEQYTYFFNGISKILLKLGNDGVNIFLHFLYY